MTPTLSNQCLASGVSPLVTECQKLTCTYVADTSLVGSADVGLRFILSVLPELLFVQTFPFLMNQCPHEQETLHLAEVPTGGLQDTHIHTHLHMTTLDVPLYELRVKMVLQGFPAGSTLHTPNFLHTTRMG